jgi:putative flippase GtrA
MHAMIERCRALAPQVSAYVIVSAIALAVDLAIYQTLLSTGLRPKLAGIIGYMTGLGLHYVLSKTFVFDVSASQKSKLQRRLEFFASGVIGLIITAGIIWIATDMLGVHASIAKLGAVGVSFIVVFLIRRQIVFASSPRFTPAGTTAGAH